jgi:hypothetical protein
MLRTFCTFLSVIFMSTFWAFFSRHFLPARKKCSKSALTDRKVQNVRSTFSAQYGVTKLQTSISCGSRTPNEVLQVPIVPHVSKSQYFLPKVLTGKYCKLLTCDTIGTVVLRLECGCTKMFPKCSQIYCPEIEDNLRRL